MIEFHWRLICLLWLVDISESSAREGRKDDNEMNSTPMFHDEYTFPEQRKTLFRERYVGGQANAPYIAGGGDSHAG